MTISVLKNMGASVRQRLLNHAKANGKPFAEVLQYYAMERFLYRLSVSPHTDKFLLKGALLLTAWRAPSHGHAIGEFIGWYCSEPRILRQPESKACSAV